jgi:amidohydrolase
MDQRARLKERIGAAIDRHRQEIIALGEDVRVHPELGFKEHRTAALVAQVFGSLGLACSTGLAITGVVAKLTGRTSGLCVAYMGEMDSVLVREHPDADPVTGAAHACGHNAQVANLVAFAFGLVESGALAELDGDVKLMAVPAEEYVEIDYRLGLRQQGAIEFLGGKPELIRLGALDDVSMVLATHQASRAEGGVLSVGGASNGCIIKKVRYLGKAAHAGGAPHEGINALKAATLGLQAIDANRETFRDKDHIRVHPIITKGGDLVNVIPADVQLETYVRGASVEAMMAAARQVDRCLRSGAMAMGAQVEIETLPGYLPRRVSGELTAVYYANAEALVGAAGWWESEFAAGSTDMGDVSHIMPAIEAEANGCAGTGHGADYHVQDKYTAYILPAKAAAGAIVDLLWNGAQAAQDVLARYQPAMTKDSYLQFMRQLYRLERWSADMP